MAKRLVVSRQLDMLQQVVVARVPPLGSFTAASKLSLLPPHLQSPVPTSSLGRDATPIIFVCVASTGSTSSANVVSPIGTPRPEEAAGSRHVYPLDRPSSSSDLNFSMPDLFMHI